MPDPLIEKLQSLADKNDISFNNLIGVVFAVLIIAIVIIWAALDEHKAVDGYFVDSLESIEATVINSSTQNIN